MPITHTGSLTLPTFVQNKFLTLSGVLCVPKITNNLSSVSKLALNNHVLIDFTNKFCFIRDRETNLLLIHGVTKGLYQLIIPSPVQSHDQSYISGLAQQNMLFDSKYMHKLSFQSNKIDLVLWHWRLGLPCKW